jgi:outer membrane receptor protein involved in Fe transport
MTLLGELRSDRPPSTPSFNIDAAPDTEGQSIVTPSRVQVVSAYAEARAPLIGMNSGLTLLRGLELQLALREDSTTMRVGQPFFASIDEGSSPLVPETIFTESERALEPRQTTGSVTFGAQVFPIQGVMLRGSLATGYLPVTANPMAESFDIAASPEGIFGLTDPRRGGQPIGTQAPVAEEDFGDPNPKPEFAQTVSVGIVLNPSWLRGLRLSVDYSRTDTSRGITINSTPDLQYLLDNESGYAGRITRAPLTAADAKMGDLAGVVTAINFSPLNIARSTEESVHIQLDYSRDTPLGAIDFHGEATWEPDLTFFNDPTEPAYNVAGDSDGPLMWRGAVGVDWTDGRWTAGVNAQIYGGYSEKVGFPLLAPYNGSDVQLQGSDRIPAQGYIDIVIAYRSTLRITGLGSQAIEYRLGVKNVLDQTPPLVIAPQPAFETVGYSLYGDPRGRRFEFTATARF